MPCVHVCGYLGLRRSDFDVLGIINSMVREMGGGEAFPTRFAYMPWTDVCGKRVVFVGV